jgi:hypothetical protein
MSDSSHRSFVRTLFLPLTVAGALFWVWKGWKEKNIGSREEERSALLQREDSLFRPETDSFCARGANDSLLYRDGLLWAANKYQKTLVKRGSWGQWQWGCLQTESKGVVILLALDSGCARQAGEFWSHSCGVAWQSWDLQSKTGGTPRQESHNRSLWKFPGQDRICFKESREAPLADSIQKLCE